MVCPMGSKKDRLVPNYSYQASRSTTKSGAVNGLIVCIALRGWFGLRPEDRQAPAGPGAGSSPRFHIEAFGVAHATEANSARRLQFGLKV